MVVEDHREGDEAAVGGDLEGEVVVQHLAPLLKKGYQFEERLMKLKVFGQSVDRTRFSKFTYLQTLRHVLRESLLFPIGLGPPRVGRVQRLDKTQGCQTSQLRNRQASSRRSVDKLKFLSGNPACLHGHGLEIGRLAQLDGVHVAEFAEERLVEERPRQFGVVDEVLNRI